MHFIRLTLATVALTGCSRFVWNEEPFTPDPAPTSEIIVTARDTTYVLRGRSYYLLASQRSVLWNRDVMDDVAWRYRELFGETPPLIAVGIDSASGIEPGTWRGVPLAVVALHRRGEEHRSDGRPRDSVSARLLAGPLLAATAAEAWLAARATDSTRDADGEPGGPTRPVAGRQGLPAWVEAGALRILASPGAAIRAAAEVRSNSKGVMPLGALFAVRWRARPNAIQLLGIRPEVRGGDETVMHGAVEAPRSARERPSVPGMAPLFIAQSVTVLAFMRERDPTVVARLADAWSRGRPISDVLAASTTLPHDVLALETEWKKWVGRAAKRR